MKISRLITKIYLQLITINLDNAASKTLTDILDFLFLNFKFGWIVFRHLNLYKCLNLQDVQTTFLNTCNTLIHTVLYLLLQEILLPTYP